MAEHMIAPLATVANTLGNLLIEEGKFLHGVEDQVKELQRQFHRIQWFLRDADAKKIEEDRIQQWVLEARDIAYDAEDLLEGYAFQLGDGGCLQALCSYALMLLCSCVCKNSYALHRLGSKIQALNSRILSLTASFEEYGIIAVKEIEGSSSIRHQLRRTYSFIEEEDFVGLESDVDLLVKRLVREDDCRVVSLSGMGGLGKTTLANKVYKHRDVKRCFHGFAWICVSQQWQTRDILQRILVKLDPGRKEEIEKQWREDELISHLFRVLDQQKRKYLIVLDDIWTTEAWDCIKPAFRSRQNGSKILLTTRNKDVALQIGPDGFHHEPRLLSSDESWELLQRKALRQRNNGEGYDMNDLIVLGKKMVEHCGGLPLAVIVLGGILSTKNSVSEWEAVHRNIKSYLWKGKGLGKGKGDLEKILGMSYNDLPFELKPCFLYLGCFPEDAEIRAVNIYQLWMAEGLVIQDQGNKESMMELAEEYLRVLGQRGMVQLKAYDIPGMRRRFNSCRLHDLMRELCLLEAKHENFMSSVKYSSKGKDSTDPCASLPASSISKVRRLVITSDDEKGTSTYISQDKEIMKYLRMVRCEISHEHFKEKVIKPHLSFFDDFEMLRVLSVKVRWNLIDEFDEFEFKLPRAVGKLIHLRYLSTSNYSTRVHLSSSLGNLKHLQTLDLNGSILPSNAQNIFLKMTGLVCLYLPANEGQIQSYNNYKIRLHGLDKLEILENFDDKFYETKDLIKLVSLRVLMVQECADLENLEMIAKYAQSNNILEDVEITTTCDFIVNKEKGLMVLKHLLFGSSVRRMVTSGLMWKFPEYEPNTFSNLLDLYINWRGLNLVENIKILEQFTCLRSLSICYAWGKEMCFHAVGFPQLRDLELYTCREMETLVVEEGAMRNLRTLTIIDCPKLQAIPEGLHFISCLETLEF